MAETIREFIVNLGFEAQQSVGLDKLTMSLTNAYTTAILIADVIEKAAVSVVEAVAATAKGFESLYYQVQRVGASAPSIKAFEYAVSQVGGTAAQADRALDGFAHQMRMNPQGFERYLSGSLHVKTREGGKLRDSAEMIFDAVDALKKLPFSARVLIAQDRLGIDEQTLMALERPGARERYRQGLKTNASAGITDKAVEAAAKFEQAARETWDRVSKVLEGTGARLFDALKGPLDGLNRYLDEHKDEINAALHKIADAIATMVTNGLADFKTVDWSKATQDVVTVIQSVAWLIQKIADTFRFLEIANSIDPTQNAVRALRGQDNYFTRGIDWIKGKLGWDGKSNRGISGFWTPERMSYAVDRLVNEAGLSRMGAAALVARWTQEAPGGPSTVNGIGATGINQALGSRRPPGYASMTYEQQLDYIIKNDLMSPDQRKALNTLRNAKTPFEGAVGGTQYERAQWYNGQTDILTYGTPVEKVLKAIDAVKKPPPTDFKIGPQSFNDIRSAPALGATSWAGDRTLHANTTNYIDVVTNDPHTAAAAVGINVDRSANAFTSTLKSTDWG